MKNKKEMYELNIYKSNILKIKNSLVSMIDEKKSATVAIALSIAENENLAEVIQKHTISNKKFEKLTLNLRKNTFYKNIWIHIIDKNGISLYRSWTEKCNDNVLSFRKDIASVLKSHNVTSSMSVGKFNLSLKAIVPIFHKSKLVGVIEVISHMNSIALKLQKMDIESIIIVNKKYSKQIKYPFTKIFIGKYYIANFNASPKLMEYIQNKGITNYLDEGYKITKDRLIVSYVLKDNKGENIGTYLMFKNISKISTLGLDFFIFKLLSIFIFLFMLVVMFITVFLYKTNKRQKQYYKNIIDSSTNIMIINNADEILSVNKVFFKYFNTYDSIEDFREDNNCICDFFAKDKTYLQKEMDGENWISHLVHHQGTYFKVKIAFLEKVYYFSVFASLISEDKKHFAITLSDITEQEKNKQELEKLTITDTLTEVGNRRYFETKMYEEIDKAYRYKYDLSLIILDIDNFKKVNDEHGHSTGDKVLIEYTKMIQSKLRVSDELCRIGGEEFVIIVSHANREDACSLAEKLRKDIEVYKKVLPITMSFGVAQYKYGDNREDIFKRADKALYKAKENGRNMVIVG